MSERRSRTLRRKNAAESPARGTARNDNTHSADSQQRKAALLHLKSTALAERMREGSFKSLYRGRGIEFSGVREYLIGDDVRSIDWNVTARMNKAFVKIYDEDRELDVFIILDASLSMSDDLQSGILSRGERRPAKQSRLETAVECASLISLACLYNSNPVGAVIFSGAINFVCPPASGRTQVLLLLSKFETESRKAKDSVPGSVLGSALLGAEKALKKRSLVFIISDFRTASYLGEFSALCEKNDVIAIKITDDSDAAIPPLGAVRFRDSETAAQAVLPTNSRRFKRYWEKENKSRNEIWFKECIRRGGVPLYINTKDDPARNLIQFFNKRQQGGGYSA